MKAKDAAVKKARKTRMEMRQVHIAGIVEAFKADLRLQLVVLLGEAAMHGYPLPDAQVHNRCLELMDELQLANLVAEYRHRERVRRRFRGFIGAIRRAIRGVGAFLRSLCVCEAFGDMGRALKMGRSVKSRAKR